MKIKKKFSDVTWSVEGHTRGVLSEVDYEAGELEGIKGQLDNLTRVLSKLIGVLTDRRALTPDELRAVVGDDEYMTIIEEATE